MCVRERKRESVFRMKRGWKCKCVSEIKNYLGNKNIEFWREERERNRTKNENHGWMVK